MEIEMFDHNDVTDNVHMGTAHFPIADIPETGTMRTWVKMEGEIKGYQGSVESKAQVTPTCAV